jgi:histidine triad (HIT) family protein
MKFKEDCIFCKIANKLIPAEIIEETDGFIVIKDMNPVAPIHLLIISKLHYDSVLDAGCKVDADKNSGDISEEDGSKNKSNLSENYKSGDTADDDDLEICGSGKELFGILGSLADKFNVADKGFRTVINTKEDGGQTVNHLHIHFMAGRGFGWPPG